MEEVLCFFKRSSDSRNVKEDCQYCFDINRIGDIKQQHCLIDTPALVRRGSASW